MKQTIIQLLKELRIYIAVYFAWLLGCFVICYINKLPLYGLILSPVKNFFKNQKFNELFIYTSILESFLADIAVSFYSAFLCSIPMLFLCGYLFFAKSMYPNEKRITKVILISSLILGSLAICFSYYVIFPRAINFLITSSDNISKPLLKIGDYVSTFFHFILGFAIVFQIPLLLFGLAKFGIILPDALKRNRKIAIVIIFIIAGIITPPDVLSQIFVAIFLTSIYEITNLVILKTAKKNMKKKTKIKSNKQNKFKSLH